MTARSEVALREVITVSAAETEAAGERLARRLAAGDVLLLEGALGSGKTTLVRGLARGLGVAGYVASPTFQLVRVYEGAVPLAHADLYRLEDPAAALPDLGLEDLLDRGIVVIEWGDRLLWPGAARIRLEEEAEDRRRLRLLEAPASWTW